MASLKSSIQSLSETFAEGVLAAIRSASLEEILGGGAPAKRGRGRRKLVATGGTGIGSPKSQSGSRKKGGRLARRSPSDIEHVIGLVVAKLREHRAGLRSEQIQKLLKLSKREIVGPLTQALAAKKISKKGRRRSTTYFVR